MKTLNELNNYEGKFLSDKGVLHNYLPVYEKLFAPFRNRRINLFEVGFQYGGSAKLWELYFTRAKIKSIDIDCSFPFKNEAIALNIETEFQFTDRVQMEFRDSMTLTPEYFYDFVPDIAIHDGLHEVNNMIHFIKIVYPIMKNGLLIIEDVQDIDNEKTEFEKLNIPFEIVDLRSSGRTDDVLLIYRK
jgi:hypothetical protein